MPSSRMRRTTCAIARLRQLHEFAVVDGDVGLAAARCRVHSVAPGTSRTMRRAHLLHAREVGGANLLRPAGRACAARPPGLIAISATAPFSATMASTGHAQANGSLQPTGRPVMGITCRPAARRSSSARSTSAVTAPSVVSVSSMSVSTPRCRASMRPGQRAAASWRRALNALGAAAGSARPGAGGRGCSPAQGQRRARRCSGRCGPVPGGQLPVSTWSGRRSAAARGRCPAAMAGSSATRAGGREAGRVVAEVLGIEALELDREVGQAAVVLAAGSRTACRRWCRRPGSTCTSMPRRPLTMDSLAEQVWPEVST